MSTKKNIQKRKPRKTVTVGQKDFLKQEKKQGIVLLILVSPRLDTYDLIYEGPSIDKAIDVFEYVYGGKPKYIGYSVYLVKIIISKSKTAKYPVKQEFQEFFIDNKSNLKCYDACASLTVAYSPLDLRKGLYKRKNIGKIINLVHGNAESFLENRVIEANKFRSNKIF